MHTLSHTLTDPSLDGAIRRRILAASTAVVVYDGPSLIDGEPIVAVLTGLKQHSANVKTGGLAQLYILRSDVAPWRAIQQGKDASICGDCGHRGTPSYVPKPRKRSCYVVVPQAPASIYRKYRRGTYTVATPGEANALLRQYGLNLRLGAYGDPAAIPGALTRALTMGIRWTGYTHSGGVRPDLASHVMWSADSPGAALLAQSQGWRTFRARTADQPLLPGEISCPASAEMGKRTTCANCLICDGSRGADDRRRHIAIIVHGGSTVHAVAFIRSKAQLESRAA